MQMLYITGPYYTAMLLINIASALAVQSLCPLIHRVANGQPCDVIVYLQCAQSPFTVQIIALYFLRNLLPSA